LFGKIDLVTVKLEQTLIVSESKSNILDFFVVISALGRTFVPVLLNLPWGLKSCLHVKLQNAQNIIIIT
jgi:hypothetical protein